MQELEDALGTGQVFQTCLSQAPKRDPSRQFVPHQLLSRQGEQHLTAVSCREQASDSVERRPEIIVVALLGDSGVQGHADFEGEACGGAGGDTAQALLRLEGGFEGHGSGGEGGAESIADGLEDGASIGLDGGAEEGVVASEGEAHSVGLFVPEASAALDVGEKERDGSGGQGRNG